jgi:hypothetical protein
MLPIKFMSLAGSALLRTSALPLRQQASDHLNLAGLASTGLLFFQTRQISRHGGNSDFRKDFLIRRERPVGPHMILPPGVKHEGRVGQTGVNYHYIVHYPEDGKYTIKKLPMTKLGGRDPVTGRKVIQRSGGGAKRLYRWIDWRRLPKDWDMNGPDLVREFLLKLSQYFFLKI